MLSAQLKFIRKANKYTQQELSKALNIERSTYASYETGRNKPDVALLKKIADVFGVSLDFIMSIDPNKPYLVNDSKPDYDDNQSDELVSKLTKDEKILLGRYRTLDNEQKEKFLESLDMDFE